jgi:hypothetical protein
MTSRIATQWHCAQSVMQKSGREDLNLRPHGPEPQTSIFDLRPHGEAILGSRVVFGSESPWWSLVALCGSAQSGILNSGNKRIIADAGRVIKRANCYRNWFGTWSASPVGMGQIMLRPAHRVVMGRLATS